MPFFMIQVDVLKKELEEAKKKIVLLTMKNDSLSGDFHDTAENTSGAGKQSSSFSRKKETISVFPPRRHHQLF